MRRVELPLALPVIFAGMRTAAVQVVSGAVLAAYIGGGGLGDFITAGIAMMAVPQLLRRRDSRRRCWRSAPTPLFGRAAARAHAARTARRMIEHRRTSPSSFAGAPRPAVDHLTLDGAATARSAC